MKEPVIIPSPHWISLKEGNFRLTEDALIIAGTKESETAASLLADILRRATGFTLPVLRGEKPRTGSLFLRTQVLHTQDGADNESYRLEVTPALVHLSASGSRGLLRGIQTVRQIFPPEIESEREEQTGWDAPCLLIDDQPRFGWRGLLFDCCRHFVKVDQVKRIIDLLAFHKMNVLHWHLTEDQGWRIEIKKYPRLTEIGAWRDPNSPYGGFYTQKEVREVVDYASKRGVMVIPEIEMPGHAMAALAAFPELSCTGGPFQVSATWSIKKDVFCAGKEEVFTFLTNVLNEVIELFPAPYVHIGADECPKERWKKCPACQNRIRTEKLKDEFELQSYFVQRISRFLKGKGRQVIGWDEIMEGNPPLDSVIVQGWRAQIDPVRSAVQRGYQALASSTAGNYFDYDVARTDLTDAYMHEPIPAGLKPEEEERILGGECCLWTEFIQPSRIENMLFPRLLATAENLWSAADSKDPASFYGRVREHCLRLDRMGVAYGAAYACGREPVPGAMSKEQK